MLVLITYAQKPSLNTHADISNGTRGLMLGLRLYLIPIFVYASSEGSGKSAHLRGLA